MQFTAVAASIFADHMTLDKDVDKVLQRTDGILTKAGYGIVDDGYSAGQDDYGDYGDAPMTPPSPAESSVQFVDSSSVDEQDENVRFDTGIPAGLKEAPNS
ncbi:putative tail assembly protein [Gordonia phage GMA2]|uniref:Putative tail assembly protein n=1 Tax=Gordonia phage GMA2 TaxID=1647283 RepID=A0A0K0N6V5_9CAUD|nr:putative tail assembly protein [Gordonia phage GMA2]AKJ72565.1 putative tail assembly protein [Gordonia phage GMA2]